MLERRRAYEKSLQRVHVSLGLMFSAEAYITATRQYVAQANQWSLEQLTLQVTVANSFDQLKLDDCSFGVTGV